MNHEQITNLEMMIEHLRGRNSRKIVAVVNATDISTQSAVARAIESGLATAVFIGARQAVEGAAVLEPYRKHFTIVDADDADDAAAKAVALVREGKADVIMKGMINTDNMLRAVLNKQTGILPQGRVLTHITVAQMPSYHKLLLFSDVAVIPYPTPEQRTAQIGYLAEIARKMGVKCPKISMIHCSEKVDERHFPFTADYLEQRRKADEGFFGDIILDGPLDVKTSCSHAALLKKHITSEVNGDADALVFPDIEAGNTFYKTITLFGGATVGGTLCGPDAPVVLASRGDSVDSKFYSLAFALLAAK